MEINMWKFYWFKNTPIERVKELSNRLKPYFVKVSVDKLGVNQNGCTAKIKVQYKRTKQGTKAYLEMNKHPETIVVDGITYKKVKI